MRRLRWLAEGALGLVLFWFLLVDWFDHWVESGHD